MKTVASAIAANCARVRAQIEQACRRANRSPGEVRLVGVTKSARPDWIDALIAQGVHDLGESRPQQLCERRARFGPPVRWHLIGHLQRNKIRKVIGAAAEIHSIDDLPLLERVDAVASECAQRPRVFLEVNVAGEPSKQGWVPADLVRDWPRAAAVRNVEIVGLMTMAPFNDDPEASRDAFRALRTLRDELAAGRLAGTLSGLSMGMSGDFEVAIEEGATTVRVGSRLFEGLT